ncbi:universal stress protein UspA [[Bacillus] enclensis]|uniref:Universal stress protein n=2 Tax=Rossellomorea TaxID=2837508 RepID=A0A0V8HN19_9BACI|nr:universal stress protein [[Bacillus] enclensis]OAT84516.1 universal stress protein UspA [Bacillus sp. MKU004]QTC39846.1 universal stress protein [Bacillus sp. V3]QWC21961.1 universal stress protein [Bacillus haikouensis]KSU63982.1 universal stress protein UspA [[Bacillus] enclensis]MBH9967837.1 universal stress protein [[Bacillus] enclensis]
MSLKYQNILVAVDGSKEAEWAFQKAIAIAKRNDATLSMIHVIDTRSFAAIESYDRTVGERAIRYAEELLEEYKKEAAGKGVTKVNTYVEYGSPKVIIPREANKNIEADLIICGATGLNAVERFLIGSVSEHITRAAHCDVLVVRTEEKEE